MPAKKVISIYKYKFIVKYKYITYHMQYGEWRDDLKKKSFKKIFA